jgi:hypothetical protein
MKNGESLDDKIKYDNFGNPIIDDNADEELQENEKIKMNLKNSSKIYYAITHSV